MLILGQFYTFSAVMEKQRLVDQSVHWERRELAEPMVGCFMGYRRVKEGSWQLANVGGLDGYAERFQSTRELEVALIVTHPRRNPKRVLVSDIKEAT